MLRPTATGVRAIDDYKVELTFDNGQIKTFDVKPYIQGTFYGKLKDPSYFKAVRTNGYNIQWADGQDICPDELWECSVAKN